MIDNSSRFDCHFLDGLLSGIFGLGGAGISASSAERINQQQIDFNREQAELSRDFNAREAQLNRSWQAGMVNRANDYNSPAQQVQRLKMAGINPLSGSSWNVNSATPSGGSAATSSPASISGLQNPGEYIGQAVSSLPGIITDIKKSQSEKRFLDSQKDAMDIDNRTRFLKNIAEIFKIKAEGRKLVTENKLTQKEFDNYDSKLNAILDEQYSRTDLNRNTITFQNKQIEKLNSDIEYNSSMIQQGAMKLLLEDKDLNIQKQKIDFEHWDRRASLAVERAKVAIQDTLARSQVMTDRWQRRMIAKQLDIAGEQYLQEHSKTSILRAEEYYSNRRFGSLHETDTGGLFSPGVNYLMWNVLDGLRLSAGASKVFK